MDDTFLTVAEVAKLLKLNEQTIRNWIDRGELAAVRLGPRRVRIRRSELDRFITAGETRPTIGEGEQVSTETRDPTAESRARLDAALKQLAGTSGDDPEALVGALNSVADAARTLAEALGERVSG